MANWEDIVLNAQTAVSSMGKKATEIKDVSRLRISAAETTRAISGKFEEIGRAVYEARKSGVDSSEKVEKKIAETEELYAQLEALNERIAEMKKTTKCPACGAQNEKENSYCPKCGQKL